MLSHRDELLQQVLALPPEDREFVAAALQDCLMPSREALPPDAVEADSPAAQSGQDFLKELQRRSVAFRKSQTSARLADDVLAGLRQRQAGETSA